MAINAWWLNVPGQRYWMEVTDREGFGSDLKAPQVDHAGVANPGYALLTFVRDGDVVLHWHKSWHGKKGIVGFSVVDGAPYESTMTWPARGNYARKRPPRGEQPSWVCALREFRTLEPPVEPAALLDVEPALRDVWAKLQARHRGALYLPFAFYEKRPIGAVQSYLSTFPVEMLDVIPGLHVVPRVAHLAPVRQPPRPRPGQGAGRIADVVLKKALERHAVARAHEYYVGLGHDEDDIVYVGDVEAYDLAIGTGMDALRVEVKGSSGPDIAHVELTDGEVRNCADAATDLFVVDGITWWREADGSVTTAGGRARVWRGWHAEPEALKPTRYRYTLNPSEALELD